MSQSFKGVPTASIFVLIERSISERMDQGGPTYVTEPYFKDAVDEMMRARTLCAKANACMPDNPQYVFAQVSPLHHCGY